MADITKCKGDGCPMKDKCFRYTAPANEYWQSYFVNPPFKDSKCDHYWNDMSNGPKAKSRKDSKA